MSVKLMAQIWPQDLNPASRKLVLLAFADAANDDGVTWMAIQSKRGRMDFMRKCSMSERALQKHVGSLEEEGFIERVSTPGKGCLWRVTSTPAKSAPLPLATPADSAPPPADSAPEPSSNHHLQEKEGDRLSSEFVRCPISHKALPAGASLEQWEAFLDMRMSVGKKVHPYVAGVLVARLAGIAASGWHAGDVLDRSTVNAWSDIYLPEADRVTGVRRVDKNRVSDAVAMSDADKRESARIAAIEDIGEMLKARREFLARVERRNAPESLSVLADQLQLRPLVGGWRS